MSSDGEVLGIKEATARAGVSTKTIRQWIKAGKLAATRGSTPYGDAYQINPDDLDAIRKVLTAVTVERQPDPRAVALALAEVVQERTAGLQTEIAGLRREVEGLRAALERRDDELLEAIRRERQTPRPWWRRVFG